MFFYIGNLFKESFLKLNILSTILKISIILLSLVTLFLIAHWNIDYGKATGGMSINMCRAGQYPLLFVVSGVVGTIMTITLSSLVAKYFKNTSSSLTLLSNGTIVILGFHMMIYMIFIKTVFGISNILITVIGMSIVALLLCIIIVVLSGKYFPVLLGNRK